LIYRLSFSPTHYFC